MYQSIQIPWSSNPSEAEATYRASGLMRTQGTIFLLPPDNEALAQAFNAPPRPKTRMSAGAVALCKHFERGGASSEHNRVHPYWPLPVGSNDNKTKLAAEALAEMLKSATWRNMMILHPGVAVYEIRNPRGFGMRWTLEVDQPDLKPGSDEQHEIQPSEYAEQGCSVKKITFRGFLEPIEGLDHELEEAKSDT